MLRPRARVGHAPGVLCSHRLLPRMGRGLVPGLVLGVLLATAGCGSDDSEKEADEPSKAALDCQAEWKDLKALLGERRNAARLIAHEPVRGVVHADQAIQFMLGAGPVPGRTVQVRYVTGRDRIFRSCGTNGERNESCTSTFSLANTYTDWSGRT